ncbi:MAG: hypothetical protein H7069_12805 [Phormidesmis sp. FL-bin-119]|nr:hypothetical protein [Pedobacter sp.]
MIKTTISLAEARKRIGNWLKFLSGTPTFKDKQDMIPRALFISFDDIKELEKDCAKNYKKDELIGIRVYFGLAEQLDGVTGSDYALRGMVVPVLKSPKSACGTDAVHHNLADPDPNYTNIYDFTSPCPKYCDDESELYITEG